MGIRSLVVAGMLMLRFPASALAECAESEYRDYTWPAELATGVPTYTRVFVPPSMIPWNPGAP